ncbi:putative flavoprotein involved in K transport [Synechococcus elongatus PCC 6311]|uniref:Flavoprotein involved in K+ transport n=3 Tax=Synechococcus elongatus TaxID=32046 RepID=Q31PZ7_SYNE7|nr:MSMEG_0569 family flavin-dependent oxidoreductase [Synechococcus elongatus]ABB56872.1 putative flavoprotein involved in K+ transport [Synechococcus elongatus PCC 7942 = FACHB-805]AJD58599.1 FAD-dependent oxidoreductase [Synechococcus elongatus UTEX 2973]MBD2588744.1 MSMEG_0569 family flavin-dependent oxidoreductase [Synechococcus elongatus FACHB-242]MBD2689668.1 MSMEG_0569 family flavin-dependent oxidoreductase [Synechococcus elongatus FACHB-1061]MBD2708274.1 MSMEG_0569 family flavin-depend
MFYLVDRDRMQNSEPARLRDSVRDRHSTIVIGAGQAGLSMAYCLQKRGLQPLVLEKHRIGFAWDQQRWDSFCLVTPNWQCRLPDFPYDGAEPEGFMGRQAIVDYLHRFAKTCRAPIREGVTVQRLQQCDRGFQLLTNEGEYWAQQVVIATGAYHEPKRHPLAARLPESIVQIDARDYRNPEQLPPGAVLVVGSGQSGCQIAEDLFLAGRTVHLSVGSAPRSPRRYRGRDVVDWLDQMGYYDTPIDAHADPRSVRRKTNHYLTGRDGGREIDLRQRAKEGLLLHGRLFTLTSQAIQFEDNLATHLDAADAVYCRIRRSIDDFIAQHQLEAPEEPPYQPCWQPTESQTSTQLLVAEIAAVIWCTGYRSDFSWVEVPVFDGSGLPVHQRGVTPVPGLYFIGLPWLHTWGSGRFCGVGQDAEYLADQIQWRRDRRDASQERLECTALLGS